MNRSGVLSCFNRRGATRAVSCVVVSMAWLGFIGVDVSAEEVRFRRDVMAVLSKAGCNQGVCHGNANGKNGFKLSLRGEDPESDIAALTRDALGRRINRSDPTDSLILRKATASIPHEGGKRFDVGSLEYRILLQWIEGGARLDEANAPRPVQLEVVPLEQVLIEPANQLQLRVCARFSDGTTRDVTRLACYEPSNQIVTVSPEGEIRGRQMGETSVLVRFLDAQATVRLALVPARPNFVWRDVPEANYIDTHVFARLRELRMHPSDLCADSVFLRRAYLDTIGILPTADETRRFLSDPRPDKRSHWIDDLLDRPEFAEFWAMKWSDLLRNEEKTLDRKGVQAFHDWIRRSIAEGKPLNEFARELIAARGSTYSQPQANYYRAHRNPLVRAETTAQVFWGLRLQCAKCHNHPFDRWSMDDYYSLGAFFARVEYKIVENDRKDRLDQHEFDGEQIVWMKRDGEVQNPRTGSTAIPRFLGEPDGALDSAVDRLVALADWTARSDNPFFARTQANRIWYHLLGRGIVEPIDDFRDSNPPVNPALLDALASDLVAHHFDLRHLVRAIMNSRTYQLSAVPNETNRHDESNFSRAMVRALQAEQLLDGYCQVTGVPVKFNGYPLGLRAGELPGVRVARRRDLIPTPAEEFLKLFGKPDRLLACECERSDDSTLGQALQLISGDISRELIGQADNRIGRLMAAGLSDQDVVKELYLWSLSRPPNELELQTTTAYVTAGADGDRRLRLEDILWGLLNSKEFLLRH